MLPNPEPTFFIMSVTTIQNTADQMTQPAQRFNMNCNNAVHTYLICQEFVTLQPMRLCHIKIKAQEKYERKAQQLSSSNFSILHSAVRSLIEWGTITA